MKHGLPDCPKCGSVLSASYEGIAECSCEADAPGTPEGEPHGHYRCGACTHKWAGALSDEWRSRKARREQEEARDRPRREAERQRRREEAEAARVMLEEKQRAEEAAAAAEAAKMKAYADAGFTVGPWHAWPTFETSNFGPILMRVDWNSQPRDTPMAYIRLEHAVEGLTVAVVGEQQARGRDDAREFAFRMAVGAADWLQLVPATLKPPVEPTQEQPVEPTQEWTVEPAVESRWTGVFDRNVDDLDLSVRAANILYNYKVRYVGQLVTWNDAQWLKMRRCGRLALRNYKEALAALDPDLTLGMDTSWWSPPDGSTR